MGIVLDVVHVERLRYLNFESRNLIFLKSTGMSYQVIINNQDSGKLSDEDLSKAEITQISERLINVRLNHLNYQVECLEIVDENKSLAIKLDGVTYHVELLDEVDQMVQSLGMEVEEAGASGDVEAPMPGKVLEFKVKPGQEVEEGDALVILEAMKMENILKATGAGTVEGIHAEVGQTVEKGALLLSIS